MLSTGDVAKLFGLTRGRICQLIWDGVIPATKWGRDYMIKEEDLAELKRQRVKIAPAEIEARPLPRVPKKNDKKEQ